MHLSADQESLMEAVQEDNSRKVNALLKKGVDPDFTDDNDDTPLGEAINNGNLAMVKALVEAGADVNRRHGYDNEFPLDIADSQKDRYGSYDPYDSYSSSSSSDAKIEKIIEYLEQKGASSAEPGRLSLKQQALMTAVEDGDTRKAKALLDKGLDPDFTDEHDQTPLGAAIEQGSVALVTALSEAGADINRIQKGTRQAPLDLARSAAKEAGLDGAPTAPFKAIARYLEAEGAVTARATSGKKQMAKSARGGTLGQPIDSDLYFNGAKGGNATASNSPATPVGQRPVFRENTLADIFNAQKWVGKAEEMEQLWNQVPKRLQRSFDFAASFAEARRETLKQNSPKNFRLAPVVRPPAPEANAVTPSEAAKPAVTENITLAPAAEKPVPPVNVTALPSQTSAVPEKVMAKRAPPKPETPALVAKKPAEKKPKTRKPRQKPPGL